VAGKDFTSSPDPAEPVLVATLGDLRIPLTSPRSGELVETQPASTPADPEMGRNTDTDFMLRYSAG